MEYEEFAADILLQQTTSLGSAEETEETMRRYGVTQETRQLTAGSYRSDLLAHSTAQADLYADRFSTAVSVCLEAPAELAGFLFFRSANGEYLGCGENVANDKLVYLPAGAEMDITAPGLSGSDTLTIPAARLEELQQTLCPELSLSEHMTSYSGNTNQLHALNRNLRNVLLHPEPGPSEEEVSDLIAATIAWMGDSSSPQGQPRNLIDVSIKKRVAKQAQEYIHANFDQSISLDRLCRLTGVGVRTLQRYFRSYFGVSIREYIKTVRLNMVRRELNSAIHSQTTVAQVAMRHGFSHLGRFSAEYSKRFGVLPNQSLASRPGSRASQAAHQTQS